MESFEVEVKVPGSTANLGPGFDTIGMALQLYTTIKMKRAERTFIHLRGGNLNGIPTDKSNLVYQAAKLIFEKAGYVLPDLEIDIESEIPLTRGLGSSAAALVGGLTAANVLAGEPFSRKEIYDLATSVEGHPDNVGASLLGGIVTAAWDQQQVSYVRMLPMNGIKVVAAIPDFELSTNMARDLLPSSYSREDTIHAISHAALLASALATGNTMVLSQAMKDRIHQPYRMHMLPGLEQLLNHAREYGALGVALSGAGPTIIALTENEDGRLPQFMESILLEHGVPSTIKTLPIDTVGAASVEVCPKLL
ncbi:homoserine kinase [Falsibacillus albus]|uniref:Homoserine kinase n=1 Tax=Falsibacillus albus TaxID=2478915 RepID=A0A3L7JT73_9BACI|nr:homoserine kinase [Falsibacillus albus]RLQ94048.1 homoserine kinase [Falsibacillus albus]